MNAILLGAASLGALIVFLTHDPNRIDAAQSKADDAEVARLMSLGEDSGSLTESTLVDPVNGKTTEVRVIAFKD